MLAAPVSLIKLLAVILLTTQSATSAQRVSPRIVGGKQTTISTVPHLVQIRRGSELCGGTLIRTGWVLTAAHCVQGHSASAFTVIGGTSYLGGSDGVVRTVTDTFVAPRFNRRTMNMDAALLKLNETMEGDNIATIYLGGAVRRGTSVKVAGWGVTRANSASPSNQVRSTNVPVWRIQRCRRAYRGTINITPFMFCASAPGRRDSCSGDSGGGAIQNGRVVGIVSFGAGCASRLYAGVYTRVSRIRKWARNTIRNNA